MRDYLEPMLGPTGAMIATFAIALLVVAVIILIVLWLIRSFIGSGSGTTSVRGRQPRLSVLDALPVDQRRRLVLVRRDNVEHLILIGGPTDIVVEASIHRPSAAQRRAEAAARAAGQSTRFSQAASAGERPPSEDMRSDEPQAPESWNEPPRAEPEPEQAAPRAEQPARAEPARAEPIRRDLPLREDTAIEETVEIVETVEVTAVEPNSPEESTPPPRSAPSRQNRPISSFLSRNRPQGETPPEPPRQLSRATPVAPRIAEPPTAGETIEPAPRAEPVRPPVRPAMPPAPPVTPPTLGDEPFGAPTADADHPVRFEPIFDIDPSDASDPGRAVRPAREAINPATLASLQRQLEQPVAIDDRGEDDASAGVDPRARAAAVGDLEKEMARLLGEISGTRRG